MLWLQSGYHDVENVKLLPLFRFFFARAVEWAETLAPRRLWLSRQAAEHENVTKLEDWVRTSGLPRRAGWTYVDHREAWACSPAREGEGEARVPAHTGLYQAVYYNESYDAFYLSMLRTWLAVKMTHEHSDPHWHAHRL